MEPLVESTSHTPSGPLILRVYAGDDCSGQVYQDDGRTFAYEKGAFLRERFTCQVGGDSLRLTLGPREGSYPAWWKDVRLVIYGWTPSRGEVRVNGAAVHTRSSAENTALPSLSPMMANRPRLRCSSRSGCEGDVRAAWRQPLSA